MPEEEILENPWCLTLPEDFADERDFKAEEAIKLDMTVKLPDNFSLWKWIYKTSNQWKLWSCTAMWTTHWLQILKVRQNWVEPTTKNIITPAWKDLRAKMGHSTEKYDGWDYVERAINIALKEWVYIEENWELAKFDWYATEEYVADEKGFDKMKRYLYQWDPIVWCIRWNSKTWLEMSAGQVKTVPETPTWWHCIALVGWDKEWFWFVNSRTPNDWKNLKSRFHIPYQMMKALKMKFNFRYWILYIKEDEKKSPEYLKRKSTALIILKALRKVYPEEQVNIKRAIEELSREYRKNYPELNDEFPVS